jgi:hypothetical protein
MVVGCDARLDVICGWVCRGVLVLDISLMGRFGPGY